MNWQLSKLKLPFRWPAATGTQKQSAQIDGGTRQPNEPHSGNALQIKELICRQLKAEQVLLYDYAGRPITRESELWRTVDEEWRQTAYRIIDDLLEKLPPGELITSTEQLTKALAKILRPEGGDDAKPKYIFTPHDGKLTIPVSLQLGKVQIQGAVPLYKVITSVFVGAGFSRWLSSPGSSQPSALTVALNPKDGLQYTWIPPGEFLMGYTQGDETGSNARLQHRVRITKGFWLGNTHVTVQAYKRFTNETKRDMPPAPAFNPGWSEENHPMVMVTWADAVAYCKWAGGRLPTEAEWEYAARAGQVALMYPWGNEIGPEYANYRVLGEGTTPVTQFPPNAWALHDMAGNAYQWMADWYDYYSEEQLLLRGNSYLKTRQQRPKRVLRGGSWFDIPTYLRVAHRFSSEPENVLDIFGFRCARQFEVP